MTIVVLLVTQLQVKRWGYISGGALAFDSIIFGAIVLSFGRATADATVYAWLLPTYLVALCAMWTLFFRRRNYATQGVLFGFSLWSMLCTSWGVVWLLIGCYGLQNKVQASRSGAISKKMMVMRPEEIANKSTNERFQYIKLTDIRQGRENPLFWNEALGASSAADVKVLGKVSSLIKVSGSRNPLFVSMPDPEAFNDGASYTGILETVNS